MDNNETNYAALIEDVLYLESKFLNLGGNLYEARLTMRASYGCAMVNEMDAMKLRQYRQDLSIWITEQKRKAA